MNQTIQTILLAAFIITAFTQKQQPTVTLTFFVEHQVEADKDFLQIAINVKAYDSSLKNALASASETVDFVRKEVKQFCLDKAKKKSQCQQTSEVGKFAVEPQYRIIRGQPVFIDFAATYEVTAKIIHTKADIGPLIDKLGKRDGVQIMSVQWQDAEQQDEEMIAIDMGLEEAQRRCQNIGGVLGEINSINQLPRFELEQKEGEGQEDEEQQEEPQVLKYQFAVTCLIKKQSKTAQKA